MRFRAKLIAFLAVCCLIAMPATAQQITGAGATFPYPVLSQWSTDYSS